MQYLFGQGGQAIALLGPNVGGSAFVQRQLQSYPEMSFHTKGTLRHARCKATTIAHH